MKMVRVAEFPPGTDLAPVRDVLESHRIPFQLEEEGMVTILYVDSDAHIGEVTTLLREAVQRMEGRQERVGLRASPNLAEQFHRTPVMMVLLVLSIVGALIPYWFFPLVHWLTFQDFTQISETRLAFSSLSEAMNRGQYWRLVTPIFLHFGIFHIVFNGLWIWELGRRVETLAGSGHFLMVVLATGVASNYGQYLWSGPSLFGGMSGVIFGLLGYIWIRHRISPHPGLVLPPGLIGIMIAYLLICMTGIIELVFGVGVANAAHTVGLLVGMLLGAIFGALSRSRKSA